MRRRKSRNNASRADTKSCPLVFFDDLFVFNRVSGMFYLVSQEAALILRAVWAGHSRDEIKDMMIERFQIEHGTAIRDTEQFLGKLKDMDLLPAAGKA